MGGAELGGDGHRVACQFRIVLLDPADAESTILSARWETAVWYLVTLLATINAVLYSSDYRLSLKWQWGVRLRRSGGADYAA
ncbi:MAG: hypothetical protein R3F37_09125 [Candidatus Competibacteraceae bacterium]